MFFNSNHCIIGIVIKGKGRKFKKEKDHVRIENAECKIIKECPIQTKDILIKNGFDCFNFIYQKDSEFRTDWVNQKQMIVEPLEGYEGLGYTGGGKHAFNTFQPFKVCGKPAMCYQEPEMKRGIVLPEIEERQISFVEISEKSNS